MDPKVGTVQSQLLSGDGKVDRLVEKIARRAGLRGWGLLPVAEGEEANLLHGKIVGVLDHATFGLDMEFRLRSPSNQVVARLLVALSCGAPLVS